jgi:hypothetical protein
MVQSATAAKAEKLNSRRARALPFLAIAFLVQQMAFFTGAGQGDRTVDHVQTGGWIVLSIILLLALTTGGWWGYSKKVRELANDEVTRANRDVALRTGFLVGMSAAIVVYVISLVESITGREAAHIVLTFGIAPALLHLGLLERRALRDG